MSSPAIDWNIPPPRRGLSGAWDRFIGPGATPAEQTLILAVALAFGLIVLRRGSVTDSAWTVLQWLLAVLLAVDLAGGIVANATTAAKRWYHRPGQGWRQHFGFVAVHTIHILLVAWLFRGLDWRYVIVMSGYLLGAAQLILTAPRYLQRPVALTLFAGSLLVGQYALAPTPGLEWFAPFLFLKLLVGHLLREEPYQPAPAPPQRRVQV